MTRAEFIAWATPAYEQWFRERPDEQPSLDRIDSSGHYAIGNLRLIHKTDNIGRSPHFKNRHAPPGMLWCAAHKQYFPAENFTSDRQKKTGRCAYCRDCAKAKNAARYQRRK